MIIVTVTPPEPPVPPEPPQPPQPPEPPLPPKVVPDLGFGLELITATRIWDLASGPVFALSGTSGFGAPDVEQWWRAAPAVDGSIYQGYRTPQREFSLPIEIRNTTSDLWLRDDRAFWDSLDPRIVSYIRVTMPDATARYLPVRLATGGNAELEIDPMLIQQSLYSLEFVAGDPFWIGEHVSVVYDTSDALNLFPGPPFNINSSHTVTTSLVSNMGDEPAWPRWVIEGPYTEATVGVESSTVTLSTPIIAGETRTIDMDPNVRSITDEGGFDAWSEATNVEFEPIPTGKDLELNLAVNGDDSNTRIELTFDTRYRRAW